MPNDRAVRHDDPFEVPLEDPLDDWADLLAILEYKPHQARDRQPPMDPEEAKNEPLPTARRRIEVETQISRSRAEMGTKPKTAVQIAIGSRASH